jgi:DNA-directed RNA polymerase delta subunit
MEKAITKPKNAIKAEDLFFSNALKHLLSGLPERSQEIIFNRYGVFNSQAMTLEEIGKKYHITRERVRQVIREVLKKVREKKNNLVFMQIQEKIALALRANGGIIEEKQLLTILGKGNESERAAVRFFLQCIDSVIGKDIVGELKFSYMLGDFSVEHWKNVKNAAVEILKSQKKPFTFEELFKNIASGHADLNLSKETLAYYLEISEEIKQNSFGKWGIAKWKEISPKGTREKAYLILKESRKPLHFREIAKRIDQYRLNKKKTHSQTVHNELIKDESFVLIGRGIYALAEWGYKKGTVKDVLEEILKNNPSPMNREEILEKVLEVRNVKKSTIVINLNNHFSKLKNGTYVTKK